MPRYRITHTTRYRHGAPATAAWQSLHLQPRHEATQHCDAFELEIAPHPHDLAARTDYFGNRQHVFTLREAHAELTITSRSIVRRDGPLARALTPPLSAALAQVPASVAAEFTLEQFLHPSAHVPLLPEARALAEGLGEKKTTATEWLAALGARFAKQYTFDPRATTISTPLTTVLHHRRGVCQDFAHLLISCLRSWGLPAAYVSGYLLTKPPPGKPRLRGADASHAWVSVFIPGPGWIDFDPTNNCFVGAEHIVTARGRDYADVSPVKGLFNTGASAYLTTAVTVEPAES